MKRASLWRTVRLGVSSLLLHKLRSALTTLGVLFGTSSVIAMLAIGEGASEKAQAEIRLLGSQNVILRSVKPREDFASNQQTRVNSYGLTDSDYERVSATFPGVGRVVPVREIYEEVRRGSRAMNPRVLACPPVYRDVTGRQVLEGRWITDASLSDWRSVGQARIIFFKLCHVDANIFALITVTFHDNVRRTFHSFGALRWTF